MALTEGTHAGEYLISEAPGERSRDNITVLSGQNLAAAAVLGRIAVGTATSAAKAGITGNGTMGAVTVAAGAQAGVYKVLIIEPGTNLGVFDVTDPGGISVGTGVVGTAFTGGGLTFTLADGSTDFVSGDFFSITVALGSLKYRAIDFSSAVGADAAVGILYGATDATSADAKGVAHVRDCEVTTAELGWPSGASTNQKNAALAQLAAAGIIGR